MGIQGAVAGSVVLSAVLSARTVGAAGSQPAAQVTLDLRVYTYSTLEPAEIEQARRLVFALLAGAHIRATWRLCGRPDDGCGAAAATDSLTILVHVLPARHPARPTISGDATPGAAGLRMVRVFRPRIGEMVETFRRTGTKGSVPQLATITSGHLVGLTIAHEIGHILGLRHGHTGVMQAQLGTEEVVAARDLTLAFRPNEGDRMRRALRAEDGGAVARDRPPVP